MSNPLIPIIIGGVLYYLFKGDQNKTDQTLADEKRKAKKRCKEISKEQKRRDAANSGEEEE